MHNIKVDSDFEFLLGPRRGHHGPDPGLTLTLFFTGHNSHHGAKCQVHFGRR